MLRDIQEEDIMVGEFIDDLETIGINRVKKLFNCKYANIQPPLFLIFLSLILFCNDVI